MPLLIAAPFLFMLGLFKNTHFGLEPLPKWDAVPITAATLTLLVAINVGLLGFLAELQLSVSGFFRRRIAIAATEATS